MTLPSTLARNDYIGAGATDTFSYTFRIFVNSDLSVLRRLVGETVDTLLVLTTDYTVTGAGDAAGGTIVLTAGNLAVGALLTIRRVRPLSQLTDIRNQGPFFARTHEDKFDDLTMQNQQIQDDLDRSLKLAETEAGTPLKTQIPSVAERANKTLSFDASGNPTAVAPPPASVSVFMTPVLGATDENALRNFAGIWDTVTPSVIVGNQNNYDPGIDGDFRINYRRIASGAAAVDITGFAFPGGGAEPVGFELNLLNIDTGIITLKHRDGSSTGTNQMELPGDTDYLLLPQHSVKLVYDTVSNIWRVSANSLSQDPLIVKATSYTLLPSDSGTIFTNEGASALVTFTLPTALAGLRYSFIIQDVDGIQVDAATGDTIRIGASVSAGAGNINATTIGNTVTLVAINATEWIALSREGTWTVT